MIERIVKFHEEIRIRFGLPPANHLTHIENLRGIFKSGGIQSYNRMKASSYVNLANESVQAGRSNITVPISSKPLHDYVPVYFGFKTPMVAANQHQNEQLVFLRFSLEILQTPGCIFTDGNARANSTNFFEFKSIENLSVIDSKAIQTLKYANDQELRRKKQAEILIPDKLPFRHLIDIICYSENSRNIVENLIKDAGMSISAKRNTGWYFEPINR